MYFILLAKVHQAYLLISKETYLSNFIDCSNFLKVIKSQKIPCKLLNTNSSKIFAKSIKKIY
tara:strand:- start:22 stop:207 length:186 start_codon:yes stop_codon:yes gene_type:complete